MPLETAHQLLKELDIYANEFHLEIAEVQKFKDFINRNTENSIYSRTNFDGHFTASAFLVNAEKTHVLLLHHKKLNRWLQPGGHIDETDESILQAAKREICEEVGLQNSDIEVFNEKMFFDLDAHEIPENTKKNEPKHTHFDIRYLFHLSTAAKIDLNREEANAFKWILFSELKKWKDFKYISIKLVETLQNNSLV